jgi:hypothetical protein
MAWRSSFTDVMRNDTILLKDGTSMPAFELLSNSRQKPGRRLQKRPSHNRLEPRIEELERRQLLSAVSLVTPTTGSTVSNWVEVQGDVSGMNSQTTVNLYVDGQLNGTTTTVDNTFNLYWVSYSAARGAHALSVQAHDASGHAATASATVYVRGQFNVHDFGARGDGVTDDTNAIQAALNAANNAGGGTVTLPVGTYLVNPANKTLQLYNNIEVLGFGPDSVIKVANWAGNYRMMLSASGDVNNLTLRNFTIDQNPLGNRNVSINYTTNYQNILQLSVGNNVTLEGMTFNEDGVQAVVLTGPHSNGVTVSDCYFHFVRANQSGTTVYDHSSLYIDGSNQVIRFNVFEAAVTEKANTAVETHGGPNVLVESNVFLGFNTSVLVLDTLPQYTHADGHFTVQFNYIQDGLSPIVLCANTGQTLRYVTVTDNYVGMRAPNVDPNYHSPYTGQVLHDFPTQPIGILFYSSVSDLCAGNFDQIQIVSNWIDFGTVPTTFHAASGISLSGAGMASNILVQANVVVNSPDVGIDLGNPYMSGSRLQNVQVLGNAVVNAGWQSICAEAVPMSNVQITGNAIMNSAGTVAYALYIDPSSATQVTVSNNDLSLAPGLLSYIVPTVH